MGSGEQKANRKTYKKTPRHYLVSDSREMTTAHHRSFWQKSHLPSVTMQGTHCYCARQNILNPRLPILSPVKLLCTIAKHLLPTDFHFLPSRQKNTDLSSDSAAWILLQLAFPRDTKLFIASYACISCFILMLLTLLAQPGRRVKYGKEHSLFRQVNSATWRYSRIRFSIDIPSISHFA